MSALDAIMKIKSFITNSLKYSSVGFIILIPLAIILTYFGFIRTDVSLLITEIVIYFGLAESIINAILNKIKKEKVEFAEIKNLIESKNFEALAQYKKSEASISETAMTQLTSLLTSLVSKKAVDSETLEQANQLIDTLEKDAQDDSIIEPLETLKEPVEFTR